MMQIKKDNAKVFTEKVVKVLNMVDIQLLEVEMEIKFEPMPCREVREGRWSEQRKGVVLNQGVKENKMREQFPRLGYQSWHVICKCKSL